MRELELIRWIRSQGMGGHKAVALGPGDDCAILRCGRERLLVTTDQVLDGVHFLLEKHGPAAGGRKAMARNLSDIAAMAGEPLAAFACVTLPKGMAPAAAKAIYRGMRQIGDRFGCPLAGGDIAAWDGPLAISVTIVGRPWRGIEPVLRSGARAGDAICVTGPLGGAWRTRRHLEFIPRIAEARLLARRCRIHAMIDISDGLSRDLGHICRESGVGAELDAARIPVHPDAPNLQAALGDGEDYELLFTLRPSDAAAIEGRTWHGRPAHVSRGHLARGLAGIGPAQIRRIGTILRAPGLWLIDPSGKRGRLHEIGWEHG